MNGTARQIWRWLDGWFVEHPNYSPSLDEIAAGCHIAKATAQYNVKLLVAAGVVRRTGFKWRTLRLLRRSPTAAYEQDLHDAGVERLMLALEKVEHSSVDKRSDGEVDVVAVEKKGFCCPACGGVTAAVSAALCNDEFGGLGSYCPNCGVCVGRGKWSRI